MRDYLGAEDRLYAAFRAILESDINGDAEIVAQLKEKYLDVLQANQDELLRLRLNAFIEKRHRALQAEAKQAEQYALQAAKQAERRSRCCFNRSRYFRFRWRMRYGP